MNKKKHAELLWISLTFIPAVDCRRLKETMLGRSLGESSTGCCFSGAALSTDSSTCNTPDYLAREQRRDYWLSKTNIIYLTDYMLMATNKKVITARFK